MKFVLATLKPIRAQSTEPHAQMSMRMTNHIPQTLPAAFRTLKNLNIVTLNNYIGIATSSIVMQCGTILYEVFYRLIAGDTMNGWRVYILIIYDMNHLIFKSIEVSVTNNILDWWWQSSVNN